MVHDGGIGESTTRSSNTVVVKVNKRAAGGCTCRSFDVSISKGKLPLCNGRIHYSKESVRARDALFMMDDIISHSIHRIECHASR